MFWDVAYGNNTYVVTGKDRVTYTSNDAEKMDIGGYESFEHYKEGNFY